MTCSAPRDLLGPFFDGELVGEEHAAMVRHLRTCEVCARGLAGLEHLRGALRTAARVSAPAGLADRVRTDIAAQPASAAPLARHDPPSRLMRWSRQAGALAAAAAVAAFLTWGVMSRLTSERAVAHDVLVAHVRSLAQDSLVQIASSDRHTVKPWFTGRTDFSPNVKDIGGEGFPLIGGRLDFAGDRRVAVVVYKRRQHVINVFSWPAVPQAAAASPGLSAHAEKGYNSLRWTAAGLDHWAISDLNAAELAQFQKLF